jgi:formylmethanofuran dehydrogenase subunit B
VVTTTAPASAPTAAAIHHDNVPCPFCGLLCDDLQVAANGAALKVLSTTCGKATSGFERIRPAAVPQIAGRAVSQAEAVAEAAYLISRARLPLFGGMASDVEGARATMALADRAGGVVDHALSDGQYRNFKVLQSSGWVMTTLTEVRNRADLIIIAGSDVHTQNPRFFERIVCNADSMFETPAAKRTIVFIGQGLDASGAVGPRIGDVISLPCPIDQTGAVISALRARLKGHPVPQATIAGVPLAAIDDLARRCHAASYGVIVWAPLSFDFPDGDLTVHAICETIRELNVTQRFAGLSLGGSEGGTSAAAVSSWQSGFPLRVSFASGKPDYDSNRYAIARMLAAGEGDLLIWTASFSTGLVPPKTSIPTIILGTPGLAITGTPAVFIPVGTPGLDHTGRMIRCDSVVSLPMRNLTRSPLPSAAQVLTAIQAAL